LFHHRVCNKKDSGGAWGHLPADTLCGEVKSNLGGSNSYAHLQRPKSWMKSRQKVLGVFRLAIHGLALRFLFLQTHATSHSFYNSVTVHCKGGKPERKPFPLPYGLRNPYRNLNPEQDYAQKPQRNCTFMNWASRQL
jgi:hypothetical protein